MRLEDRPYLREIQLKRDEIDSYDEYPFCIPAVKELDFIDFHPDVTFFVGENGTGKSTLIEGIAVAQGFNPESGTKSSTFSTSRTHSPIILAYPRSKIYQFSATGIYEVNYEETEHYAVTKDFLNRHEQMMKILMEE
ncbi:MAG: AAA family ATPase [Desulfobacteraceae bacterium]|nr:AAA family ATPase [Desulfobacteraceae bacterium]